VSVNEVKGTIRAGNRAAEEGKVLLEELAADVDAIADAARHTLHDSQDDDVLAGLGKLKEARREVTLTARRLTAAVEHANAYIAALG
jgi:hypothetical protein